MDPLDRLSRIADLQERIAESERRIAERQAAREADPIAMDDYLRSEQRDVPSENIPSERDTGELIFKEMPLERQLAHDENWDGWNRWLRNNQLNERETVLTAVGEVLDEMQSSVSEVKAALTSAAERAAVMTEVRTKAAEVERQRVENELNARDAKLTARLDRIEGQIDALCRYLSVAGHNLPKGV
jgi:hypothetical protein